MGTLSKIPLYNYVWAFLWLKRVPIENIRCQDMPFSEKLGFSGKPISHFPPCKFFQMYMSDPQAAQTAFSDWLYHCLITENGWKVDKSEGGMKNGTLMEAIFDMCKAADLDITDIDKISEDIIRNAITQRVRYYLGVFDSVRKNNYKKYKLPPIIANYRDGLYYLKGGHHRVSTLYCLGYKHVYLLPR